MNCRSLKTAKSLRINITKNVTLCYILIGKGLPIHYSTIADLFRDVFCDGYLRSFTVLHFRTGHIVVETPVISEYQSVNVSIEANFHTVWEIQKIHVCPFCG